VSAARAAIGTQRRSAQHAADAWSDPVHPALTRALDLSRQILAAAEGVDLGLVASLDAERMQLLKSFKLEQPRVALPNREVLEQIMALNERAVGLLEHRKRGKGREMDMAAVGRRAVAAYAGVRMQR
jgi:hypothetical protein